MVEVRTHSYLHKTLILHIDRRKEFKRKLLEKDLPKNETSRKYDVKYDENF